ncbi:hypothetical protein [Streptomyces sp. NBC_00259]|uniref:hypothetical protein n=1 Tax=Streptomyces sp. NBC_00259 TaxID=2903643 RepID=UPI002E2B169E|nr:hypothetical protein [Streptomyces sp. NBC_00259]
MSLRWKIAVLLASGCALVAVTIGLLIHHARMEQLSSSARAGAVAQLVRVRQLYELTGRVDPADNGAALDSPRLPAALRASAPSAGATRISTSTSGVPWCGPPGRSARTSSPYANRWTPNATRWPRSTGSWWRRAPSSWAWPRSAGWGSRAG